MTSSPPGSTADAISPDSDRPWADAGAWPVAPGVHRIPLPLPTDALRAVNVYAIETPSDDGARSLTLIDGGWAIAESAQVLRDALASIDARVEDIRRVLVTHVHRDHYTQAISLRQAGGAHGPVEVALGRGDEASLRMVIEDPARVRRLMAEHLRDAGSPEAAEAALAIPPDTGYADSWELPDRWIEGAAVEDLGSRVLDAVPTPGHTAGHVVFADRAAELLFAGDHVLPTITPSIGFEPELRLGALADFLGSLARVRELPDLRLLPAHGPLADSAHARVAELLRHHEDRLELCRAALDGSGLSARQVAGELPWTRRRRALRDLNPFDATLATLETRAHLEVLVARGQAIVERGTPLGDVAARYRVVREGE